MVKDDDKIVNLADFRKKARKAEKHRDRARREAEAAANRVKFGRTGPEKSLIRSITAKEIEKLDAHKRETPATSPSEGTDEEEK